ncbi:hypothetical protein [Micromonospora sp. NPDC049891]|uniref:hypothetical protein n=1 Tax=Micromonospora sp. NPDC049891 TaxID=3155655 RepID=UPI0033DF67F0
MLHNAIRYVTGRNRQAAAVQPSQAVTGRAATPDGSRLYRAREVDGPTVRIPLPNEPGVNKGRYSPRPGVVRHRAPNGKNEMPEAFTRQRVVA